MSNTRTIHDDSPDDFAAIEAARRVHRRAAACMAGHGLAPCDNAIAAIYAAHDLAMHHTGNAASAIDWLRDALDLMERQLLEGVGDGKPATH